MWNSGLGGMGVGRQRWSLSNVRYRYSLPSRVKRKLKKHWSVEKKNANFKEWRVNPWFSACLGSFLAACFFHGMLESQQVVTVTLSRSYSIWSLLGILSKWTPVSGSQHDFCMFRYVFYPSHPTTCLLFYPALYLYHHLVVLYYIVSQYSQLLLSDTCWNL